MAILKHYTIDPKTQQYAWKISLIPGIGGGGGNNSDSKDQSKAYYACLSGTNVFAGYNGQTVIKHSAKTVDYKVFIIPTESNGDIGEYWVENKTDNSFIVKNSGSNKTASFDWFLVTSNVTITDELEKEKRIEVIEKSIKNGIELNPEEKEKIKQLEQIIKKNESSILEKSKEVQRIEEEIKNIKVPVKSVNRKTGAIELKAADITTTDGTTLEDFKKKTNSQYEDLKSKKADKTEVQTAQSKADSAYNIANSKQDKLSISSSTTSTSTVQVANSYAVKQAMDRANEAFQQVSNGKNIVRTAITDIDSKVSIPLAPTFSQLANAIKNMNAFPIKDNLLDVLKYNPELKDNIVYNGRLCEVNMDKVDDTTGKIIITSLNGTIIKTFTYYVNKYSETRCSAYESNGFMFCTHDYLYFYNYNGVLIRKSNESYISLSGFNDDYFLANKAYYETMYLYAHNGTLIKTYPGRVRGHATWFKDYIVFFSFEGIEHIISLKDKELLNGEGKVFSTPFTQMLIFMTSLQFYF